jgi:hypothetical protein
MQIDLSLNRVYWEYTQNKTYLRPERYYQCSDVLSSMGCRVTTPEYKRRGESFKQDLDKLVSMFAKKYSDYEFVLALSGGIDSEVTAESFYTQGIPFRAVSQRLFEGINDYDIGYAAKYCKDRFIDYSIVNLSMDKMLNNTIPNAIKYGQFTHSYSQIALTNIFGCLSSKEIIVFSGHNPDFHRKIGIGWWEDSPNIVKYAIAKKHKFFTFTSLEPIFCHYAAAFDDTQPGDKNNDFIYEAYPQLTRRIKMTGWEKSANIIPILEDRIRDNNGYRRQTFITWDSLTLKYLRELFSQNAFKDIYYE